MDFFSIQALIDWVTLHQQWAYLVVFLVAVVEALTVVGILVPGIAIMLGIGTLVGLGALHLGYCLLWATLGAIVGDGISFWLGRRFHQQLRNLWPLTRYPELIPRGEAFFQKHGGKGVLLCRFFGPVRAILPTVAGMLGMPPLRFYLFNIVSAVAWAPAILLPGVAFGASLSLASEVTGRLAGLLLGFIVTAWVVFRLVQLAAHWLQPRAERMVRRLARLEEKRFVGRMVSAVIDPDKPELLGLFTLTLLLVLAMAGFLYFLKIANGGELYFRLDSMVEGQLRDYHMPWLQSLSGAVIGFGSPWLSLISGVLITGALYLRRYRVAASHWLSALLFAWLAPLLISLLLANEARAALPVRHFIPDLSLLLTTIMTGMLCVMISREMPPRSRWLPYSVYAVVLLAVSFAYFYWREILFVDVLGGITLGLIAVALLGIAYQRHADRRLPAAYLGMMSLVLLALPLAWGAIETEDALPRDSHQQARVIEASDWWDQGWRQVSLSSRVARVRQLHPVTWQWAGDLPRIEATLARGGWRPAVKLNWRTSLFWLAPDADVLSLPVLPHVYDGYFPLLTLVHETQQGNELKVLRVWRSTYQLASGEPIWLGNVSVVTVRQHVPFLRYLVTLPDYQEPLRDLYRELSVQPLHQDAAAELQFNQADRNLLLLRW